MKLQERNGVVWIPLIADIIKCGGQKGIGNGQLMNEAVLEYMVERRSYQYSRFIVLGLPTWALVDVTWSMLSQLAAHLPEEYTISVYLMLSLTVGNVFPLVINRYLNDVSRINLRTILVFICSVGLIGGCGMALFWNHTTKIGGQHCSLIFYFLFLLVGACSSTSNVTHFIYVSQYPKFETTCLSTGMALGSTTAGILGILQGLWLGPYGMSVSYTYVAVAMLYLPAILAVLTNKESPKSSTGLYSDSDSDKEESLLVGEHLCGDQQPSETGDGGRTTRVSPSPVSGPFAAILQLHAFNSVLGYGVIPSLISPICSRFRSAPTVLLLATGISCTLDPLFRSLTAHRALQTAREIQTGTCILAVLAVALIVTLLLPHDSLLLNSHGGIAGMYPVITYVTFGVSFGYINTSIFLYLKHHVHPQYIQEGYRWAGVMSQTGALIGSLISFALVISGSL